MKMQGIKVSLRHCTLWQCVQQAFQKLIVQTYNRYLFKVSLHMVGLVLTSVILGIINAPAQARNVVTVGVSVSATGPAASLGIPEKNTVDVIPKTIEGTDVRYFVLDDATDTTQAVRNMRKLISDNNIDVMVGSSVTAGSLALVDVGAEMKVPVISMAGNAIVITPAEGAKKWAFKTSQNDLLMAQALRAAMQKAGVKTLAVIGFADAYGTSWLNEMQKAIEGTEIKIITSESYSRTDTSVTGQVMKIILAKPDAVLVATAGTPGALPQRELKQRGYKGITYHTPGSANNDFLRVCAKACEGVIMPVGPISVVSQLPDEHPSKAIGLQYAKSYNDKFGADSVNMFGGHMWDAAAVINAAIPVALSKGAKPGTVEFREALRDALENNKDVIGVHGVFNPNAHDHNGLDGRARVLVTIKNGAFVYTPKAE